MRFSFLILFASFAAACGVASDPSVDDSVSDSLSAARATCSTETRPQILEQMAKQPLTPPKGIAGLDLSGGAEWSLLSQAAVEAALCAGTPIASEDPKATTDGFGWGEGKDPAFIADFDRTTHKLTSWQLNSSYTGTLAFKSRAGSRFGEHTYLVQLSMPILRDGQPFVIDPENEGARDEAATELHDGIIATFAPELPSEQTNCRTSTRCLLTKLENGILLFGVRDVRFYMVVTPPDLANATTTVPELFYGFPEAPAVHPPPRSIDRSARPR